MRFAIIRVSKCASLEAPLRDRTPTAASGLFNPLLYLLLACGLRSQAMHVHLKDFKRLLMLRAVPQIFRSLGKHVGCYILALVY